MPESPRSESRPLLVLAAVTVFVVLGYAVVATILLRTDTRPPGTSSQPAPAWVLPPASPPVSMLPAPSSPAAVRPSRPATQFVSSDERSRRATQPSPSASTSRSAAASATSSTPAPALVAGSTIGLGLTAWPGYRLQHQNFVARINAITAQSSAVARLDARFTVRAGRADPRCFSFESVNHPGYFLRHRNFILRLDAADGSALFDADSTFCPVLTGDGFALRSVNYPTRHLSFTGTWFELRETAAGQATAFRALPPL